MRQPWNADVESGVILSFSDEFDARRNDALFQFLLALALAIIETLVLYLALILVYGTPPLESFLGQVPDSQVPWFAAVMLSRGLLQPLNFFLFGFGATLLLMRLWVLPREFGAFRHPFFAGIPLNEQNELVIGEEARGVPLANVKEISREYMGALPLLVRRIAAGGRRLAEEGDANQVHAVLQAMAELDRNALESRYTIIKYIIWLIPSIGFLGTVMGIGRAIAGFTTFLSRFGGSEGDFQAELQPVLVGIAGELGVAFDTTVLALLLSACIVALTSMVQSREETLLSRVDEFCLSYFVSRIAVPDFGTKQLGWVIQQAVLAVVRTEMNPASGGASGGGFTLNDLAGRIENQTEQLKTAIESVAASGPAAKALPAVEGASQAILQAVEKLNKSIESLQGTLAGTSRPQDSARHSDDGQGR